MSTKDLTLGVLLKLTDKLSGPAATALSSLGAESAKAARAQRTEFERLSRARELLGVRSEQSIQREIRATEAAYRRLADSGKLSFREQARAADAMRQKITALNNEMGRLTLTQKAMATGRFVAGGVAGAVAAGYVLKPSVDKAMDYDLRLAHMANTAFSEGSLGDRKAGVKQLDRAILAAIRAGGGTRDQAAETLDALIASGAMNVSDATGMLPTLMKSGTASGADPKELANIAIRAMQTFKIKPQDLPRIIDMAVAAGQAGGFELKDMAKWLPQQMAAATASGMSGTAGFAKLASLNQAAIITAGSKDEAGNNLVNLLAKINSSDTAKDAEKLGINLPQYLAKKRSQGVDSVDAFVGLVDQSVGKLTAWKQLQTKLKSAKDDSEKRETLESMASIVQGSGVGKLVQDRQALMALVAIMNNRDYLQGVQTKTLNSAGAVDRNFGVISDTASFSAQQAANARDAAQQTAMESLFPWIKQVTSGFADLAEKHPHLATAAVAATGALTALAAAAGAAGLTSVLTGKGAGAAAAAGGMAATAGGALKTAGGFALRRMLPLWGAWEAGQWAGGHINNGINWSVSKLTGGGETSLGSLLYDVLNRSKVGGEIRIHVDQDGRVTSVTGSTENPNVPMFVEDGRMMVN